MSKDGIYLDYNATAPVRPEAAEAVRHALESCGNPSSVHAAGRQARGMVETARSRLAALINTAPDSIIFTSGATEANVTALTCSSVDRLIVSATEHDSLLAVAKGSGLPVDIVPVDSHGVVDLAALERALTAGGHGVLVSLMLANNETGVIQPVAEAARLAHGAGALIHCDAAQALGKIPVDMAALGVDLLSLSAHKMGGPQGVGALVLGCGTEIVPLIRGGGQERNHRAGTENVPGIAGFGAAVDVALRHPTDWDSIRAWRDRWEVRLKDAVPDAVIFGAAVDRLPNTSCVAMPGVTGETQVMALDLEGICVSSGSACSSGKVKASHVLQAMGAGPDAAGSAIRVSPGWASREADLDRLFEAWLGLYQRTQRRKAG